MDGARLFPGNGCHKKQVSCSAKAHGPDWESRVCAPQGSGSVPTMIKQWSRYVWATTRELVPEGELHR